MAVSTACPALDYIVVDTTSAAQRCVELLRQRQLGVATFLILDKQQHLAGAVKEKKTPPEGELGAGCVWLGEVGWGSRGGGCQRVQCCSQPTSLLRTLPHHSHLPAPLPAPHMQHTGVKRLFDLVKCKDEGLKVAFYYALRDTLVAADLEQASRIAYGRDRNWRRVVTMKVHSGWRWRGIGRGRESGCLLHAGCMAVASGGCCACAKAARPGCACPLTSHDGTHHTHHTLQGEMINESGTMTGGGGKPRGGRMCLGSAAPKAADPRAAAAELQAAEEELAASQDALRVARDVLSDAAQEAKVAERALGDLETAIPKVGWVGCLVGHCGSEGSLSLWWWLELNGRDAWCWLAACGMPACSLLSCTPTTTTRTLPTLMLTPAGAYGGGGCSGHRRRPAGAPG